jgi:hypothetical protein
LFEIDRIIDVLVVRLLLTNMRRYVVQYRADNRYDSTGLVDRVRRRSFYTLHKTNIRVNELNRTTFDLLVGQLFELIARRLKILVKIRCRWAVFVRCYVRV